MSHQPQAATASEAVFKPSVDLGGELPEVRGPDFNTDLSLDDLLRCFGTTGFQATGISRAIDVINQMISWRLSDDPPEPDESEHYLDPLIREQTRCKVFLGFTSNMISSGVREVIRFLVQHGYVDCLVTTAGGVEEDLIKCLGKTYVAEFELPGKDLREKGLNRIGNLLVPNDNYCRFQEWIDPLLTRMLEEQKELGTLWSPSSVIARLGKEINDESSVLYWCWKNDIPVFCPALTDGSLGDMIFFHSFSHPGLVVDLVSDIRKLNRLAYDCKRAGMVVLGGGVCKHHVANAMLMRNGADYSVFVNTAQEFDGSDAGARPDEAVSWGKIRGDAKAVKVFADATVAWPLIVAGTWARKHREAVGKGEKEEGGKERGMPKHAHLHV
ncbi:Deoxyhypusine synthase [Dacryopinax primogenitus]|uniref:deoxyhypusine synthase n=1 Tax=Dacryopinax primogenitus (strain DJM 731) TaxID=1858805 RepID=M5G0J2_DACPD|nr:Deoxyhypusine synthase [Dacryopinax primogenitus]EJU03766.1 Deoxyhypusine synthase [Dacryopinax primogenitus]